jgi:GT2 family glycosyltransferase
MSNFEDKAQRIRRSSLAVLLTTHGNLTNCTSSISALDEACDKAGVWATVYLANSGASIRDNLPTLKNSEVVELQTSDTTYWAGGMRVAWEACEADARDFEYVLWLNDDTQLMPGGLSNLLSCYLTAGEKTITIGSCRDSSGKITYGGYNRGPVFSPLNLERVVPSARARNCDTFNGNLVLLSGRSMTELGGFPRGFTHLRADIHFGFMAAKRGFRSLAAAGFSGVCELNLGYSSYEDIRKLPLIARLRFLNNPKFGPLKEHIRFSLLHGGPFGVFYALAPIAKVLVRL